MRRKVTLCLRLALTAALALQVDARAAQDPSKPQQPQQPQQQAPGQPQKVDLDELEDKPERYLGRTVTVQGEVDRVLGPHLFKLGAAYEPIYIFANKVTAR